MKKMTGENDIVLVYFEDQPLAFARVEAIIPDVKKNWYQVRLLFLQLPLKTVTWTLRDVYIDGQEFTMGGKRMRLEKIVAPKDDNGPSADQEKKQSKNKTDSSTRGTVITLSGRKPKT